MANYAGRPGSVLVDGKTGNKIGTFDAKGLLTSDSISSTVATDILTRAGTVCKTGYKATITSKVDAVALGGVGLTISGGVLQADETIELTTDGTTGVAEIWLAPGTYNIAAKKTGYVDKTDTVTVASANVSKDVVLIAA